MSSLGAKRKTDKRVGLLYLVLDIQGANYICPVRHIDLGECDSPLHVHHKSYPKQIKQDFYLKFKK